MSILTVISQNDGLDNNIFEKTSDTSIEESLLFDSSNEDSPVLFEDSRIFVPVRSNVIYKQTDTLTPLHDPILEIEFDEYPYNHNMHIAFDGEYLYTINGGNTTNGQINKFGYDGTFIQTFPIAIDGRGLSYNPNDGYICLWIWWRHN